MNEELEVYSDTNKLKKSLDDKRELLLTEKEKILGTRDTSKANLEKLQSEVGFVCLSRLLSIFEVIVFNRV